MNSNVMLFDEPTGTLDPEMTGEALNAIKEPVATGMTMLHASTYDHYLQA